MKKFLLFPAFLLMMLPSIVGAQNDIANLFKAGVNDIQTLAQGYVKPLGYGISDGLGMNWYNTAATHKPWGFDITVGATGLLVPSSDKTFSLAGLTSLQVVNGQTTAPTFGGKGDGVELKMTTPNGKTIVDFTTPSGVTPVIPGVNAQFTLGLPKGNDLSFRFVPNIQTNRYEVGLWGIGLKHNFKQWIPGLKLLPFDAAVMVGYTHVHFNYYFDNPIMPNDLVNDPNLINEPPDLSIYANQGMHVSANSLMANVIVSKKLLFFTPYVGFGVTSSRFDFNFAGNYPVLGDLSSNNKYNVNTLTDPIPLHYSSFSPGLTVGFRLKFLWIFALHVQYTVQQYSAASVGLGINIR
ncbi:MAG: DUF6588 family protein [Microbacter sp.]